MKKLLQVLILLVFWMGALFSVQAQSALTQEKKDNKVTEKKGHHQGQPADHHGKKSFHLRIFGHQHGRGHGQDRARENNRSNGHHDRRGGHGRRG